MATTLKTKVSTIVIGNWEVHFIKTNPTISPTITTKYHTINDTIEIIFIYLK